MNINNEEFHISKAKAIFSAIPIVGGLFNEIAFDYHSRIQQNRLNNFIEILVGYFSNYTNHNIEKLKNEDFADIFIEIIKRVTLTKSANKHELFKNVIINFLHGEAVNAEHYLSYLDLINSITEKEIEILTGYSKIDPEYLIKRDKLQRQIHEMELLIEKEEELKSKEFAHNLIQRQSDREDLKTNLMIIKGQWEENQKYTTSEFYNIDKGLFLYYKQSLHSKGLLMDIGIGRIEISAFQIMGITEFGKQFIEFIISENINN